MSLYLIAILPPEDIHLQVMKWKVYMLEQFQCKVALKSPAHITLIPPFQLAKLQQTAIEELLCRFAVSHHSFKLDLENFSTFAPRVIYLSVTENSQLAVLLRRQYSFQTFLLDRMTFRKLAR